MKKIIFVFQLSYFYFRKSLQTLYDGIRNPTKFYEEERRQTEIIKRILPALVFSAIMYPHEYENDEKKY